MQCYGMSCHIIQGYDMQCYGMQCYIMQHSGMQWKMGTEGVGEFLQRTQCRVSAFLKGGWGAGGGGRGPPCAPQVPVGGGTRTTSHALEAK